MSSFKCFYVWSRVTKIVKNPNNPIKQPWVIVIGYEKKLILHSIMSGIFTYPEEKGLYGIFNDSFPPIMDGVTLTVENYAYHLRRMGKVPCVVTPWNPESAEDYDYHVMRYFSLPIASRKPYRYGYPKLDPFIWHRLRSSDFRIVHSHCPFSSGRLAVYTKKKHGIPLIGTFHSKYKSDLEHSFRRTPWMVAPIMRRILEFFNACDEVWIPQAQVEETVREYGFKGPLTVVENGSDFAVNSVDDLLRKKKEARDALLIAEGELAILFVGQHIWDKGIGVIADALSLIDGKISFRMNFIGDGYAADSLGNRIRDLGLDDRVVLHGVIRDRETLFRYYAASDLFLFPSYYDNAPLVIREAAAAGTPAVVPVGSTASEVIRDGFNGFLTGCDGASYAEIISRLVGDRDTIRMAGIKASETIVRSWSDIVEEVIDRYETLIKTYRS